MLQQILRDMWVDPEILAGLDEEQKQTLFCKMREEQVRRWKMWDEQCDPDLPQKRNDSRKNVNFLKGSDGEPWVWVMGEHENDRSIEEILKEETIEKARKLAEKEAEELRKQVEAELSEFIDLAPKIDMEISPNKYKIEDEMDIYCSVDELREKMANKPNRNINNYSFNHYQNKNKFNMIDTRDVLQEISLNTQKVAQRVALWEKRLTEERTCEIFQKIQKKRMENAREAEEAEKKQEQVWREQERKAKEAELQIREIARKAREQHRLNTNREFETAYSEATPAVPPGKQAVLDWYKTKEFPKKAGVDPSDRIEPWFHGLITRVDAENLLMDQPDGTFLVRLSERIWGYALSYKAPEKCKHYLVNAGKTYKFLGSNHIEHQTLRDLIDHHHHYPLSGGEKLKLPCPKSNASNNSAKEIFADQSIY